MVGFKFCKFIVAFVAIASLISGDVSAAERKNGKKPKSTKPKSDKPKSDVVDVVGPTAEGGKFRGTRSDAFDLLQGFFSGLASFQIFGASAQAAKSDGTPSEWAAAVKQADDHLTAIAEKLKKDEAYTKDLSSSKTKVDAFIVHQLAFHKAAETVAEKKATLDKKGKGEHTAEVEAVIKAGTDTVQHLEKAMETHATAIKAIAEYTAKEKVPEKPHVSSDSLMTVCRDLVDQKLYITTALAYTNGPPHIGHTYEIVTSDVLSRYFKAFGMNTTLLAGTDEHGLKVATTAENSGMYPIELADYYSAKFRENNDELLTAPEIFVRTTEPRHHKSAQKIWRILRDKGDIYLGEYSGWYNVREETFLTEVEAAATDYKDPLSGKPYKLMKELSYFFRMSKYQQRLIDKLTSDTKYLQPDAARSEILSRLKKPLEDLSVSRCTFNWGIPVPDDPGHVMYVWSDALTGYLSAIGFGDFDDISHLKLWPPDVQVIGKDIIWFFAVIWTSILMSLDIALPKTIFAHGFITAADGRKMSKSLGNVVHTKDLLVNYGVDTVRYYMIRDSVFGSDVKFDLSSLADLHNSDLTDTIGNLVHRITTLCVKFCGGCVPKVAERSAPRPFNMIDVASKTLNYLQHFALQDALVSVIEAFRDTNKYLTDREPWAKGSVDTRLDTIRNVLEAVYFLNHLMQPVVPLAASVVFKKLGTEPRKHIGLLSADYNNLNEGTKVGLDEAHSNIVSKAAGSRTVPAKSSRTQRSELGTDTVPRLEPYTTTRGGGTKSSGLNGRGYNHRLTPPVEAPNVPQLKQVVPLSWVKGSLNNGGNVTYHSSMDLARRGPRDIEQHMKPSHTLRTPGTTVLPLGTTPNLVHRRISTRTPQENPCMLTVPPTNAVKSPNHSTTFPSGAQRKTSKSQSSMLTAQEDDKSTKIAILERDLITTKVALADSETQRDIELAKLRKATQKI
ncbi:Methionine--tRNA ligase [Babesia sp. Xinjiang]|uniref:Methionine--tRNA ligase n=1 Tax=Babesia sp. Xinjiang TaxID=462227 RepID=UPI000A23F2A9|nr:Methionine--tRNA ligase [Babesia sp. Xinjiang]ORM41191.1 Methionine--tRNA ligase [Babesia sp. Xinjiang]